MIKSDISIFMGQRDSKGNGQGMIIFETDEIFPSGDFYNGWWLYDKMNGSGYWISTD